MQLLSRTLHAGLTLTFFLSAACAQVSNSTQHAAAVAHTRSAPVMKGKAINPVIRVAISVPAGSKPMPLQGVRISLDAHAAASIDSVEIYLTGATPFHDRERIGMVRMPKDGTTIPAEATLGPGLHFVWISPVLSTSASIDKNLSLQCSAILLKDGKSLPVKQTGTNASLRTGVAVRKVQDDNVHTYRIPGIAQTDKGTLISVYDIRYLNDRDLPGHIDVGMSRSTDGGNTWEPMKVIM
ncbi:MAG TPA: BNR-repeat neuraminidase N-terminal domain-containing protein, partial [Phnomibacter sp.]|nr:BNR-repeat neuraminidase N-terminal domain-containing protein [Phnomibacter sp.]